MPIIRHSKFPAPLERAVSEVLGPTETDALFAGVSRPVHLYGIGSYQRLRFSARERSKYVVWEHIEPAVLASVRAGDADLMFDMALEILPVSTNKWRAELDEIYDIVLQMEIDPRRIVIANCNPRSAAALESVAIGRGHPPMRALAAEFVFAYYWAMLRAADGGESPVQQATSEDRPLVPFLSLNRKLKRHRVATLLFLLANLGPSRVVYSLLGEGTDQDRLALERQCAQAKAQLLAAERPSNSLEEASALLIGEFPRYATDPLVTKGSAEAARTMEPAALFRRTLLSIVGETSFGSWESTVVTEKVMKPIMMQHPFVIVGDPGCLGRLRKLGFSTFAPVIDESYDEIEDPQRRFQVLTAELMRIGSLSDGELRTLRDRLQPIVSGNAAHLQDGFARCFRESLSEAIDQAWRPVELS